MCSDQGCWKTLASFEGPQQEVQQGSILVIWHPNQAIASDHFSFDIQRNLTGCSGNEIHGFRQSWIINELLVQVNLSLEFNLVLEELEHILVACCALAVQASDRITLLVQPLNKDKLLVCLL